MSPSKSLKLIETQDSTEKHMLREQVVSLASQSEQLAESLSQVQAMLSKEDQGWKGVFANATEDGLSLDDLRKWSIEIRNAVVGNSHIKRGLSLRSSYVWQDGIQYREDTIPSEGRGKGANVRKAIDLPLNKRNYFNQSARAKKEGRLYYDGIALYEGNDTTKILHSIPLREITDDYRDRKHSADVMAYRHTWTQFPRGGGAGVVMNEWIFTDTFIDMRRPTIEYEGKTEKVSQTTRIFDQVANGMDDFAYGSPDALAALLWSRIAKNLYMNGVVMTDALATFAFKATVASKNGAENVSMKLANAEGAGNTATVGGANDLVPLSSAGKGYDFLSFQPVIAIIAASLDVSAVALTSDSSSAGGQASVSTLDLPTRLAMEARRAEHVEFEKRILSWMGAPAAEVYFQTLTDPTDLYRAQQGQAIKLGTGLYTPEEIKIALEKLEGNHNPVVTIPDGFLMPNNLKSLEATAKANASATPEPASATNGGGMAPTQGSGAGFTGGGSGDQNANDVRTDGNN